MPETTFDVVIVGAGVAGAIVAHQLAAAGRSVLVLEAGPPYPMNRSDLTESFYRSAHKFPESPYPPVQVDPAHQGRVIDPATLNAGRATVVGLINAGDNSKSYLVQDPKTAFASTYERMGGGTTWHWMGTCLRLFPNDFRLRSTYGHGRDWPLSYDELEEAYGRAEWEIGVSAERADMERLGFRYATGFDYPMLRIPQTIVDRRVEEAVRGMTFLGKDVFTTPTPQGRKGELRVRPGDPHADDPYADRRTCAGNSNCIPLCPIQSKYDATVTLQKARQRGAQIQFQTVASNVRVDATGRVAGIDWIRYDSPTGPATERGTAVGKSYVLAAHAMETPKLLLLSNQGRGVSNSSGMVGRNLMDHVMYLAWARGPLDRPPLYPYRGPLSTSGIETLRDGAFRHDHAAFRVEIGNEGWNWATGDPTTAVTDFIDGRNAGGLNADGVGRARSRADLKRAINDRITRTFRLGFLFEQEPDSNARVVPSSHATDHLGLPRPEIQGYGVGDYTKRAFPVAKQFASEIFRRMGAEEFTQPPPAGRTAQVFELNGDRFVYYGAGHIMGTCRMGASAADSVVGPDLRSWDHKNLFIVGSSVFPAVGTGNPTLTIAALSFRAADRIHKDLGG